MIKRSKGPLPGPSRITCLEKSDSESEYGISPESESEFTDEDSDNNSAEIFALRNPVILFEIFRYLDIEDLKTTRHVSKLWCAEASKWLKRESVVCFTEAKEKRLADFVPHLKPKNGFPDAFAAKAINFCIDATYLKECKAKHIKAFFDGVGAQTKHLTYRVLSRWVLIKRQDVTEGLEINLSLAKRRKFGTDILQMLYAPYCSTLQALHVHESRVIPNQGPEDKERISKKFLKKPSIEPLPYLRELTLSNISLELYGSQIDSLLRRAVNLRKLKFVFDLESRSSKLIQMFSALMSQKSDAFVDPSKQFSSGFYFFSEQIAFLVTSLKNSKLDTIQFPSIRSLKAETFETFIKNQNGLQVFRWLHRNHLADESVFAFADEYPIFPILPELKEWITTNVNLGSIGFVSKMPKLATLNVKTVSVKDSDLNWDWDTFFPLHGTPLDEKPAEGLKTLVLPHRPRDGYIGRKIVFYFPNLVSLTLSIPSRRVLCTLFEEYGRIDGGSLKEFKLLIDFNNRSFKQFMERDKKKIGFANLKKLEKLELIHEKSRENDGPIFLPNFISDNPCLTHLALSHMTINDQFFENLNQMTKLIKEVSCTNCAYIQKGSKHFKNSSKRQRTKSNKNKFIMENEQNVSERLQRLADDLLPNIDFFWTEFEDCSLI